MVDVTVSDLKRRPGHTGYHVRLYFAKTKRRTWRKVGETRQQALRNRRRLLVELAGGREPSESVKVSQAVTQFKRLRDRRLAEKTRRLHESHYVRWRKHWGRRLVSQITTRDVERHFARCEDLGWSGSTLNRERTLLRSFFKCCKDRGWLGGREDPTRTIKR